MIMKIVTWHELLDPFSSGRVSSNLINSIYTVTLLYLVEASSWPVINLCAALCALLNEKALIDEGHMTCASWTLCRPAEKKGGEALKHTNEFHAAAVALQIMAICEILWHPQSPCVWSTTENVLMQSRLCMYSNRARYGVRTVLTINLLSTQTQHKCL